MINSLVIVLIFIVVFLLIIIVVLQNRIKSYNKQAKKGTRPQVRKPQPVVAKNKNPSKKGVNIVALDTLYLGAPNSNGLFHNVQSNYIATETIYKLLVYESNIGEFEFINETCNLRVALDFYDRYIEPACEAINAFDISANIVTVTKGLAEKRDNKWIVKQKARIRYE